MGLAVGLDDSRFNEDTRVHKIEFEEFSRLYENVIDRMLEVDITIFTVGLVPVPVNRVCALITSTPRWFNVPGAPA